MTTKLYTAADLKKFDRITNNLSSQNQMTRLEARFKINNFIAEHGKEKCGQMFKVLQERDKGKKR